MKPIEIQINNSNPENISIEDQVKVIKKDFKHIMEMQKYNAKIKRGIFLALVDSGFTEDQAMWLIK